MPTPWFSWSNRFELGLERTCSHGKKRSFTNTFTKWDIFLHYLWIFWTVTIVKRSIRTFIKDKTPTGLKMKSVTQQTATLKQSADARDLCQSWTIFSSNPRLQIWHQGCLLFSVGCSFGFLTRSGSGQSPTHMSNSASNWEIIEDSEATDETD